MGERKDTGAGAGVNAGREPVFPRPRVVVSRCLGFDACRYNGQTIADPLVALMGEHVEFLPVCPEVEIGLGVPRDPIRIVQREVRRRLLQPATGREVTGEMERFCREYLAGLGAVDGFLLKSRSPSCGPGDAKVYTGEDASGFTRGPGLFAAAVRERFPGAAVEDEGRLKNFAIREHFLTSLYTSARFRKAAGRGSMAALVGFHTVNKLLFMGYSQSALKRMGTVVANQEHAGLDQVLGRYRELLSGLLARPPRFTGMINVLHHALGGLSDALSGEERRFFLNLVEEYRDERVPLSVPLRVLEAWGVGRGNRYLQEQTLLNPFPRSLVEITDSGKGRNR
ncbi:MAG: YbgA family protein [Spirochaetota bacterium]